MTFRLGLAELAAVLSLHAPAPAQLSGAEARMVATVDAGRAGLLVARHRPAAGSRARKLLLIGHLDTVFEPDSPFQRWTRKGNDGIGPGASANKGGIAVIVAAV